MMKDNTGEMKVVDWKDAIVTVAKVLDSTPADKMAAVVGGLADAEVCNIVTAIAFGTPFF